MISLLYFHLRTWLLLLNFMPAIVFLSSIHSDKAVKREHGLSLRVFDLNFCNADHFTCGDGSCIPTNWECDWYYDCLDHTDEHANCEYKENGIVCGDLKTISSSWICDGFPDCNDGEDELDFCESRTSCIRDNKHLCDDQTKCIGDEELCDGVFDCSDRTDEDPRVCGKECFLCDYGTKCIPLDWPCDYIADCADITDETDRTCGPVYERCEEGEFLCKNNFYCIPQSWRCDGETDCGDQSDEVNCERESSWHESQGWGEWSSWTDCDTDCGQGVRQRNRECVTNNALKICEGDEEEKEDCNETKDCPGTLGVNCGHRFEDISEEKRVVGGKKAVHGDWPWQAQLIWAQGSYRHAACGGTLIHPKIVISAAHCFMQHMADPTRWLVHLGKHDIIANDLEDYEVERRIMKLEIHPNFNPKTMRNDIAILVLDSPVLENPSEHIRWACLDQGIILESDECFISGWGVTEMGGNQAIQLKEAEMPIINTATCNARDIYGGLVQNSMLCAGHMEGGIDACQGDSGGPLSCKNPADGLWYLVGITSWGHGCALPRRPGVYTRAAYFADYILQTVEKYI